MGVCRDIRYCSSVENLYRAADISGAQFCCFLYLRHTISKLSSQDIAQFWLPSVVKTLKIYREA